MKITPFMAWCVPIKNYSRWCYLYIYHYMNIVECHGLGAEVKEVEQWKILLGIEGIKVMEVMVAL